MTFEDLLNALGSVHVKINGSAYSDLIHFNQYTKTISNGKIILMKNGNLITQTINVCGQQFEITDDMQISNNFNGDVYEKLEDLYETYRYSIAEPYDNYAKSNFIAVPLDKLSREQFNNGKPRQQSRIQLESFVMFHEFPWNNEKNYYWQSQNNKSLIIYKEWRKAL